MLRQAHAEIKSQVRQEHPGEAVLAEISGKFCHRLVIVFIEGRAGVDVAVGAFLMVAAVLIQGRPSFVVAGAVGTTGT